MSLNRAEVEVGINRSAPWMPTKDALDGYLEIDVVSHKWATAFCAAALRQSERVQFQGRGPASLGSRAPSRTERAARKTDSYKILPALESFALSARSGLGARAPSSKSPHH
jgi:hypothetical protein